MKGNTAMLKNWVKNKNERKLIYLSLIISIIILGLGCWTILHQNELNLQSHNPLKSYAKNKGSLGRIGVFTAFAMFPLYYLIRLKKLNGQIKFKKFIGKLLKWCKLIHVPVSLIAFVLITIHSVIMTFFQWKTNAVYISGVITYLLLIPLGILGFLRYKRKDKNWHYYLSFAVVISMLIHTFI